ncbi:MAG TPA: hypothetical protein PK948_04210 [Gemmatimonadales bacterium]|jgi:hypothetical protein|nr:hypothetical protein [Gemmatimonadales bacterium]
MSWRVVEHGDTTWKVSFAAERTANTACWRLVLSFRAAGPDTRSFWATYPLESTSRSALYNQADRIPADRLAAILSEHLG